MLNNVLYFVAFEDEGLVLRIEIGTEKQKLLPTLSEVKKLLGELDVHIEQSDRDTWFLLYDFNEYALYIEADEKDHVKHTTF